MIISCTIADEDYMRIGDQYRQQLRSKELTGTDKQKAKQIEEMVKLLQTAMQYYTKDVEIKSKNGTFALTPTLHMGLLFFDMAEAIANQDITSRGAEEMFAERIGILTQLPSYYEQARPIFQHGIDQALKTNPKNKGILALMDAYIATYYFSCKAYNDIGKSFLNAPMPDSSAIVTEYVEYEGMMLEDAIMATHEDMSSYREELDSKRNAASAMARQHCETGLQAAKHYNIKTESIKNIQNLMKEF